MLIDAIPLSMLPKLRNFLCLGSPREQYDVGSVALFGLVDAKTLCMRLKGRVRYSCLVVTKPMNEMKFVDSMG